MASFQFLHCADLHIDSPLRGLEADPTAPVELIRKATRNAFVRLVDYAIAQEVRFVLAAGDLYDGDWPDWHTGQFLIRELGRLNQAGIPFIPIRGNHDADSVITRHLNLPYRPFLAIDGPEIVTFPELGVRVVGQSFRTRAVVDNLAAQYPAPEVGTLDIGLLHTCLDGQQGHANYAPCSLQQLLDHGYGYWALGHIHKRQVFGDPACWVVYPGNIQGRHARETGPKGAMLVTVRDGRISDCPAFIPFDTVRWEQVAVDLDGARDEDAALALVRARLIKALDEADDRLLVVRVILRGASPAHSALNQNFGATLEKLRAEALTLTGPDALWLEKVEIDVTAPEPESVAPGLLMPAIQTLDAATFIDEIAGYTRTMLDRAPALREVLGDSVSDQPHPLVAAADKNLRPDLFERARSLLLARVTGV